MAFVPYERNATIRLTTSILRHLALSRKHTVKHMLFGAFNMQLHMQLIHNVRETHNLEKQSTITTYLGSFYSHFLL